MVPEPRLRLGVPICSPHTDVKVNELIEVFFLFFYSLSDLFIISGLSSMILVKSFAHHGVTHRVDSG